MQHKGLFFCSTGSKVILQSQSSSGVYLSMLRAHRLSTVIPTEAFCTKGTSLHSVTPKGQSSASSWRERDKFMAGLRHFRWESSPLLLSLSLIRNPAITTCEPKFTPESSFALMFSVFSLLCIFFFFNFICHGSFGTMNQGVMMGHDKQHYPAHPWQSVSLLGLDLCLSQWNVSLDQLGSYVVPYRSETTSFWSGMQPCPVVLACLPLYPNTLAPSPLSTLTHAHTEANR